MTPAIRMIAVGAAAFFGSPAVAQAESCLNRARDLTTLEACTQQEIRPLEEQYVRGTKRLLSKYPDAEADKWEQILHARDRFRHNNCMAEGEIYALRSDRQSTLEKRRGFAICQKRILQSLLQALADCEQTSSQCERAMTIEAAGVASAPIQGTVPQLTETQKQLMVARSTASARARVSYCSGATLQAVADLERLIPLIEGERTIWSSMPTSAAVFNYALALNHGRLAKLYGTLGNQAQSEKHKDIARSLKVGEVHIADPFALVSDTDTNYCAGPK